jgi:hypothetical protein
MLPWNPPNYRQYYSVAGPYSGQHFTAIKVGDVDGSWTNTVGASFTLKSANRILSNSKNSEPIPQLAASSATTNPAGGVAVSVIVTNFSGVTGVQFSLDWDPSLLTYVGITARGLPLFGSGNIGVTYVDVGRLAIAWDDVYGVGVTLPDGTNIFQINFTGKGTPGISAVNISDLPTAREVVIGISSRIPATLSGQVVLKTTTVAPVINSPLISNNRLNVVFPFLPGTIYGIDHSTNLIDWISVRNPQFATNGFQLQWIDGTGIDSTTARQMFFRVNAR